MPGRDGTGPLGEGPMTGGGFGYCTPAGSETQLPVYGRLGRGRGLGLGRGRGVCGSFRFRQFPLRRNIAYNNSVGDEKQLIENELKYLEGEMNELKKRLDEIK